MIKIMGPVVHIYSSLVLVFKMKKKSITSIMLKPYKIDVALPLMTHISADLTTQLCASLLKHCQPEIHKLALTFMGDSPDSTGAELGM